MAWALVGAAFAAHAVTGATSPQTGHQRALLDEADAALARGDPDLALARLEIAAGMGHTAAVELLIVRAWLQRGEFRRALGFCAHTAAAHRESTQAVALYRLLLELSGQHELAQRVATAGPEALTVSGPVTRAVPPGAALPQPLVGGATALLLDDGRHAVTAARAVPSTGVLWLRNGLGETVRAEVARQDAVADLALLRLEAPLQTGAPSAWLDRDAFGGSAAYAIGFRAGDAMATWPQLHAGFLAAAASPGRPRPLGIDVSSALDGGPVFDAAGRIAGLTVRSDDGPQRLVSGPAVRAWLGPALTLAPISQAATAPRIGSDEVYERALTRTLQLLTVP